MSNNLNLEDNKQKIEPYHTLDKFDDNQIKSMNDTFNIKTNGIKKISFNKLLRLIKNLYTICRLHYISIENKKNSKFFPQGQHPIQPKRGEIYNAIITENVGSELSDNHLVIIISNEKTNIFAEKVNVIPIEGDGNIIPKYLVKLENSDLEYGKLDKSPSRIIVPEILTIDKSRLGLKIGKITNTKMLKINKKIISQLEINIKELSIDKKTQ